MLKPFAGFLLIAGDVIDQTRVQFLEDRIPFGAGKVIDCRDCALAVIRATRAPGRKQGCGQIGNRPADRLRQVAARSGVLLALERTYAEDQLGNTIILVGLRHAFGEFYSLVNVAIDQKRQKGAVEQLAIVRVALECRPIIGGCGGGIALLASVTRGQVTA